jgi:co-chaperonin GroES (HSP10)
MKVLGKKLAVKVNKTAATQTASGLYIAGTAESGQILKGKVVERGWETEDSILDGDIVHFNKFNAPEVTVDGETYYVLTLDDVLVIE